MRLLYLWITEPNINQSTKFQCPSSRNSSGFQNLWRWNFAQNYGNRKKHCLKINKYSLVFFNELKEDYGFRKLSSIAITCIKIIPTLQFRGISDSSRDFLNDGHRNFDCWVIVKTRVSILMTPTVFGIDYITGCPIIESCFRNQICTTPTEGKCDDKREKGSPLIMQMDGEHRFARIARINIPLIIVPEK